jgi:hypothetical protein
LKKKAVTITLLIIMGTALLITAGSPVKAQSMGLYIYEVILQNAFISLQNSTVDTPVSLIGTINTANGAYTVHLADKLVDSGTASGYYVVSNFTIPEIPGGNYYLTLTDVAEGLNTTFAFPILTEYSVKPILPASPSQLQEGSNVVLNVTVTGGEPNTAFDAEIIVTLPPSLGTNFTKVIPLTTSPLGTAQSQITFPDSSFSPSGSTTIYAGSYIAYFNQSQGLAQKSFTIGFTDQSQYHRQDTVGINAVGYQPNQSATLTIQSNNGTVASQTVTASSGGVITSTWQIPSAAAIETYTVTITPQSSPSKTIADSQDFQISGYPQTFTAVNLAGEILPDILVEAVDNAVTGTVYSNTTTSEGKAVINLEKGTATVDAYWNQVKVGEIQVSTTASVSYNITCQLSDLKIKIQDKNGAAIPFTDLNMTYQYVNRTGATQTGTALGQTDLTGTYTFNSTLPNITYLVNASKYGAVFNSGNNTISNLAAQPTVLVTVLCPSETLTLNTVDYNGAVLPNARVTLIEQASGIFYSVTTDSNGNAQLPVTFGKYQLSVYTSDNVLLNETVLNVLSNTQSQIRCALSNLQVIVKVVDYFGNPISNINVQLSRQGMNTQSATTQSDGKAPFSNVLGGNIEVTANPAGNQHVYVAKNIQVNSPTTVTLSMEKYVALGGALVDASLLATLLIIILVIVLLIVIEVFRRTGFKLPSKKEN